MMWLWKRETKQIEPRRADNTSVLELETAKEILAEIFHIRPNDVEEMIQRRLEERDWANKRSRGLRCFAWVNSIISITSTANLGNDLGCSQVFPDE
jgi:hypothetical protein